MKLAVSRIMLAASFCVVPIGLIGAIPASSQAETGRATKDEPNTKSSAEKSNDRDVHDLKVKVLPPEELERLLNQRLSGWLGYSFAQFANMFFVTSRMDLDVGVGLTAHGIDVEKIHLEPAFPSTYRPTLKELLDAIAMQTKSHWTYEAKDQLVKSSSKLPEKELEGIAIIMFSPAEQTLPYEMTPPKDWLAVDRTNWIMYVPPIAPLAMDLHVSGRLSASDKAKEDQLFKSAPVDAALDVLKRVRPDATSKDLKKTKVGPYDAYFFENQLPTTGEGKIRWRQWHFMVGNQLCFVISTIKNEQDDRLYPDVEAMLKTFRVAGSTP